MIEIFLSLVLLAGLAKHGKRRGRALFVPRIDITVGLGAILTSKLEVGLISTLLDQECWAISMKIQASITALTAGEGPIMFGVAHSDYSAAEIEEWIEEASSWISSNLIGQERARRKCRIIGTFMVGNDATILEFNEGRPTHVKLGWKIEDGQSLGFWAYNQDANTLTTGALMHITGPVYLRPM